MKNLLMFLAIVLGAYYFYTHPRVETVQEPTPVVAQAPPPPPKVYFHSPLDAPAMSTSASTGTGYYSTDPNSRFTGYQGGYVSSFQAAGGYPVYTGGGVTNNHVTYNNYGTGSTSAGASASTRSSAIVGHVPYGSGQAPNNPRGAYPQQTNY